MGGLSANSQAQAPQWQPHRVPANSQAQPLSHRHQSSPTTANNALPDQTPSQPADSGAERLGSGVVLRWKTVAPTASANELASQAAQQRQQATIALNSSRSVTSGTAQSAANTAGRANPLRSQVIQTAYQGGGANDSANPFADNATLSPPALPQSGANMPSLPGAQSLAPPTMQFDAQPAPNGDQRLPTNPLSNDPLDMSELPPPPPSGTADEGGNSILESQRPAFPAPSDSKSPSDRDKQLELAPPSSSASDKPRQESSELKRRNENANMSSCDELRARLYSSPLELLDLNTSPAYGEGFRSEKDPEQQRLDFAASTEVREWCDYRGYVLARGRMIDLRHDRVVIDVDGQEQSFLLRDLCDADVAYVGEAWNIPERCGTGYEPFRGRNFIPATTRWAASGVCHKPLYFEQVQLERYGHEIGPVLQPLVSAAHFFGSIPLLPYKMGIHPPNECQYALGYYRVGDCAPYMIQPIPWSLRGAAVEAGVVGGAVALIP